MMIQLRSPRTLLRVICFLVLVLGVGVFSLDRPAPEEVEQVAPRARLEPTWVVVSEESPEVVVGPEADATQEEPIPVVAVVKGESFFHAPVPEERNELISQLGDLPRALAELPVSSEDWTEEERQQVMTLAESRGRLMKALIQKDPQQALEQAMTPAEIAALDPEVREAVEQWIGGEGFFGVRAVCSHDQNVEHGPGCQIHREVILEEKTYIAHIYGDRWDQLTTEDDSIYGVAVGNEIALFEKSVVRVEPEDLGIEVAEGEVVVMVDGDPQIFDDELAFLEWEAEEAAAVVAALEGQAPPEAGLVFDPDNPPTGPAFPTDVYDQYVGRNSHQLGPKTLMIMVVKPSDGDTYGASPPNFTTLDGQMDTLSQWYYNVSYKQTWFGPKEDSFGVVDRLVVTVELDIPLTVQEYKDSFGTLQSHAKAAVEAQGGDWTNNGPKDPDRFDRWMVISKSKLIGSTGLAYVGGKFSWSGSNIATGVAYHELGHNWGVVHANHWIGDNDIPRNASGSHDEYGDGADVMGGGGTFNPLFKEKLGFLYTPDGDIIDATTSGTYRIFDHTEPEADKASTRARALKVPIDGTSTSSRFLMFSLRHNNGTDGGMGRASWNRNALELHSDQVSSNGSNNDGSHFLDTTPGSQAVNDDDRDDGGLVVGRTYSEPADLNGTSLYGEVHVTPIARGNLLDGGVTHEYMDVVVNLGDFTSNQAPTASFTTSAVNVNPGDTVTFTSTSTDPDLDTLAYSWTFGDERYSYDNSGAQVVSWSTPGLYEVELTITDKKGGTDRSSVWINVGNIPFQNPENPSATLAGLYYRYYEAAFTNLPDFDLLRPTKTGTVPTFSISPRDQNDNIAFHFEGYINIPATDVYTFYLDSKDGAALYIGDTLVVDNDHNSNTNQESQGNIALNNGLHRIRVEYFHATRSEKLEVDWKGNSTTGGIRAPLADSFLFQQDWTGNDVPLVAITSPVEASTTVVGNDVTLVASASDADGIDRVVFFAGNAYLGEDSSAPYEYLWLAPPTGTKEVVAIAYDTTGRWAESALRTFEVTPPEVRRQIGLNLGGDKQALDPGDMAGAIYSAANWNNLNGERQYTPQSVVDSDGLDSGALVSWESRAQNPPRNTLGDTSSPNGRMMRGLNVTRYDFPSQYPRVEVEQIPYIEYDVYVYFDNNRSQSNDRNLIAFDLDGERKYGRNSDSGADTSDTVGDYPTYDTFTGFREATATDHTDPLEDQIGNYVVFRAQIDPSFRLEALGNVTGGSYQPVLNAVQIVEAPPSTARVHVQESDWDSEVSEAGSTDTYTIQLTLEPTNGASITVDIVPDAQLQASPSQVTFTSANYDTPQTVILSAVNDDMKEDLSHSGSVSHTVTSSVASNYSSVGASGFTVTILDDDKPTLSVVASGSPAENGLVSGSFQVTRSGITSNALPEVVSFTLTGTATAGQDYGVSGATSFNNGTGSGTLTIPGGADSVVITLTPVDDQDGEGAESIDFNFVATPSEYEIGIPSAASLEIADDEVLLEQDFDTWTVGSSTARTVNGNNPDGWTDGTDGSRDYGWTIYNTGTPSSSTGPTADNTSGSGNFLYTESSSPAFPDKRFDLVTPPMTVSATASTALEFTYSMFGSSMGTLYIDVANNGVWTNDVFNLSGQQTASQSEWKLANVDLTPHITSTSIQIRFRGVSGSSYFSDMAIDDVRVLGSSGGSLTAPVFVSHPADVSVIVGDQVQLIAVASGNPSPTYQWKKDTVNIPGATSNTYTIPSGSTGDSGIYTVVATNSEGSITSNPATVTVSLPVPPSAPDTLAASAVSTSQIDLTWNDTSSNESGFEIERSTTGGGAGFSVIHVTTANATSYSDQGLNPSSTYFYRIRAVNIAGGSSYTSEASDTTDDPPAGSLQLTASSWNPDEADGTVTITVERVSGSFGAVSIDYSTSDGSATAGDDYTAASGTLNWANGDTSDKTFDIPITDDGDTESAETFTVTLSNEVGAARGSPSSGTVTITDNDIPGTLALSAATYTVGEGDGTVTITVTRTGGSVGAASVNYATSNGSASAGSDYASASGILNWSDGDSADKTFDITITDDGDSEPPETINVTLSSASGASLGAPATAAVTIEDDEAVPLILEEPFAYGGSDMNDGYGSWQDSTNNARYESSVNLSFTHPSYDHTANTGGSLATTVNSNYRGAQLEISTQAETGTVWFSGLVRPDSSSGNMAVIALNDRTSYSNSNSGEDRFGLGYDGSSLKPMFYDKSASSGLFGPDLGLVNGETYLVVAKFNLTAGVDTLDFWVLKEGDTFTVTEAGLGTPAMSIPDADFGANLKNLWLGKDTLPTTYDMIRVSVTSGDAGLGQVLARPVGNPPPVISVDSPTSLDVKIPGAVGMLLETTVTDDDPYTVTWSQVSGPGTATFESPNGEDTAVTFSANGTYTLRITAEDSELDTSTEDIAVEVGATSGAAVATTIMDWGGEYVTAKENFRDGSASATTGLNLDLDGNNDDSRREYGFSDAIPLSPSPGAGYTGPTFYGGVVGECYNGNVNFADSAVVNNNTDDRISLRYQTNGTGQTGDLHMVVYFKKADFLNGGDTGAVVLDANSELRIPNVFSRFDSLGNVRWLVRNGSQFYVSSSLIQNTGDGRLLDGTELAAERWAPYDPTATLKMDFDQAGATFDVSTSSFGDITAVGFIVDKDIFTASRHWITMDGFEVIASLVGAGNVAASVEAGTAGTVDVGVSGNLDGTVTDDGIPGLVSTTWSMVSGTGTATLGNNALVDTTVQFSETGTKEMRLVADDGEVKTFDDVSWTVNGGAMTPAEQWRDTYFSQTENSGNAADDFDFDNDGVVNIIERAFGSNPTDQQDVEQPTQSMVDESGTEYFSIQYRRLTGGSGTTGVDYTADGIVYYVQVSSNVDSGWNDGAAYVEAVGQPVDNGDGTETVTVRAEAAMSGQDKVFLRVRIEPAP